MKWIATLIAMNMLAAVAASQPIKEWRFLLKNGEARIYVNHGLDQRLVLGILGPPCGSCASLQEMASALTSVVRQMPALGLDPAKISFISAEIDEPEVRDQVALLALKSKEWLRCERQVGCPPNGFLVDFLNQAESFQLFDEALQPYGLKVHVASAEKVSVARAASIKGFLLPSGMDGRRRVPVDGQLVISVIKNH